MAFEVPDSIWHSDQGKQYGARETRSLLLQKGFVLSMSRPARPPIMALRNALSASSSWLSLIVAPIILWGIFYGLRRPGSTFTIWSDHMRGWITSRRSNTLSSTSWRIFLHSPYGDVYFSRDWTKNAEEPLYLTESITTLPHRLRVQRPILTSIGGCILLLNELSSIIKYRKVL
jgi:hypothetical protein